jgi:hypothetical protein
MSAAEIYQASPIKRERATKDQVALRREALFCLVYKMRPMTVRQVFYQASVRGIVEKTEAGYAKIQTDLVWLRRNNLVAPGDPKPWPTLPYSWLTDSTRWQRKPRSYDGAADALAETARLYRKALWSEIDAYVEVWLEKDALSGVVYPITAQFDVPLMVARGYASLSFLHNAAEFMGELDCPIYIYHLGDFDPSGVNAGEKIEETLRELAPSAEIHFEPLAVLPYQISEWSLPTRPTKKTDTRAKDFGDICVELDAIEPDRLRQIVRDAIEDHLPPAKFATLKAAEESERAMLAGLVGMLETRP